jgi:hypothetical protein
MGKYTHKKRIYGGIPPTPPPLPPLYKKTTKTLETEEKYKRRLDKLYEKMREEEEEEKAAEKLDNWMIWASRGTGKKYEPKSKTWKNAIAQSKKRGGKNTRKHKKSKTHKKYRK